MTSKLNTTKLLTVIVLKKCLGRALYLSLQSSFSPGVDRQFGHFNIQECSLSFLGIRGKGFLFKNGKGKNFVGSRNQEKALNQEATIEVDDIRSYLNSVN